MNGDSNNKVMQKITLNINYLLNYADIHILKSFIAKGMDRDVTKHLINYYSYFSTINERNTYKFLHNYTLIFLTVYKHVLHKEHTIFALSSNRTNDFWFRTQNHYTKCPAKLKWKIVSESIITTLFYRHTVYNYS